MQALITLRTNLRQLLGDELSLVWEDKQLDDALLEAQQEYFRRTKGCRLYLAVEPYDTDLNFKLPDESYNLILAHNDDNVSVEKHDYETANRIFENSLESARPSTPSDLYNSTSNTKTEFQTYPKPKGELTIYDQSASFGITENIEGFELSSDFGIVGGGIGLIGRFSNWEGEKVNASISLKTESNIILVRFFDALAFRAGAKLLQIRQETLDNDISDYYQVMFNKYVTNDIRLLKRKEGQKANGGFY